MENIQNQSYYKVSPLAFLRTQNKNYTREIKRKNRRIKKKKHLISEIYQNHNIFHHSSTMQKRRLAQNIIWQRNYELKMSINLLKEENNSVKAKLWNIEK